MKQRGIVQMYLFGAVAVAALMAAVVIGAYRAGQKAERAYWQARELQAMAAADQALTQAHETIRAMEHNAQAAMVAASDAYQKEISHVRTEKDRVIADLRARTVVLRDPWSPYIDAHPMPGTAPASCGCDAGEKGELSESTAEFLVALASEADEVVAQLGRCQQVVRAYQQLTMKGDANGRND
jgi:hypothetical protein